MLRRILFGPIAGLMSLTVAGLSGADGANALTLRGTVESGGTGLEGYEVSLYASFVRPFGFARVLGRDTTGPLGEFEIDYRLPARLQPILFVRAEKGPALLASAIRRMPTFVVVNELTTVATGFAFAQFVDGKVIRGNPYGMLNAVHMAANMANPETGGIAEVLDRSPNGHETEAGPTFHSLANIVANCVGCQDLFGATTLPGGPPPATVLQAVANIARYPWLNVSALFQLSFEEEVYGPALAEDQQPAAWTLFLKFTGSFSSVQDENNLMNGPGNFAIDRKGFLWVNDNYVPEPPETPTCAGMRLLKFYPWGRPFPDLPMAAAASRVRASVSRSRRTAGSGSATSASPEEAARSLPPTASPFSDRTGRRSGPAPSPPAPSPGRRRPCPIAKGISGSPTAPPIPLRSTPRVGRTRPSRSPSRPSMRARQE